MHDDNSPKTVDICLVLEATYPYVSGGVSVWVDQLIKAMPEVQFGIIYLGGSKNEEREMRFEVPKNVTVLEEINLFDFESPVADDRVIPATETRRSVYQSIHDFYYGDGPYAKIGSFWRIFDKIVANIDDWEHSLFMRDMEIWELTEKGYNHSGSDTSFVDFFWMTRTMHMPLLNLLKGFDRIPKASVYHTICTGYAGIIASYAAQKHQSTLVLSEHGIYTKERIVEIARANWIFDERKREFDYDQGLGRLKQTWTEFFKFLSFVTYQSADYITTLFNGNVRTQMAFGADKSKIAVIPNGIDPTRFAETRQAVHERWKTQTRGKTVGFIGRIVPIKDIKTLLRAARIVADEIDDVEFLLAGPYQETPDYYNECLEMMDLLNLHDNVKFLGMQNVKDLLPKIDCIVLTSVSEGFPLVLLEAFASGIPAITSDVGACREIIYGRTEEDRQIGPAGAVTSIMSPDETASAIVSVIGDVETMWQMGENGYKRTEKYYIFQDVMDRYRALYEDELIPEMVK